MTAAQRARNVIQGEQPDRPPVSFWHHFPPGQIAGRAAVEAHLNHLRGFGLDFLKVMNDNGYPHRRPIERAGDLRAIQELQGDEDEFARQLELLRDLRKELGADVPLTTTIFNAWSVLRGLVRPPRAHRPPEMRAELDQGSARLRELMTEDPLMLQEAIRRVGVSLGRFARKCIEAGANGVFLSIREDWVELGAETPGLYQTLVRPSDLEILRGAAGGTFNMLHICGKAMNFRAFAEYPVQVINWADREAGLSIADAAKWVGPAICGGVDNLKTLPEGTSEDVKREVKDAIAQAAPRSIMIAPGCTYDPEKVPRENLDAMVRAVAET